MAVRVSLIYVTYIYYCVVVIRRARPRLEQVLYNNIIITLSEMFNDFYR